MDKIFGGGVKKPDTSAQEAMLKQQEENMRRQEEEEARRKKEAEASKRAGRAQSGSLLSGLSLSSTESTGKRTTLG